jgi:branched-chain amino acid transport system permease protein
MDNDSATAGKSLESRLLHSFLKLSPVQKAVVIPVMMAAVFFLPAALTGDWLPNNQVWRSTLVEFGFFAIAALGLNILVGYCGLLNLGFAGFMCIGAYTAAILMKTGVYLPFYTETLAGGEIMHYGLVEGGNAVKVMLGAKHGAEPVAMTITEPITVYYYYHFSYWTACVVAMIHGAVWGVILGLPTLHLTGDYFAIVTFGFAELVMLTAKNNIFELTNGTRGFPNVPGASLDFGWLQSVGLFSTYNPSDLIITTSVTEKVYDWYVVAFWLILVIFGLIRLSQSRLGRAWRAIREDELAAEACGINTRWYKTQAFAISAALGALAGAIQAAALHNVDWANFKFIVSVYVLCYVVLGGMGTIGGAIAGTALLVGALEGLRFFLKDVLPSVSDSLADWRFLEDLRLLLYGLVLVVFIRFRPEGLIASSRVTAELHPKTDREREHEDANYDKIKREEAMP